MNRKLMAIGAMLAVAGSALAQPPAGGGGLGQNPPNQQPGGPGGGRPDFGNMTQAQREQMFAQFQERRVRGQLDGAGVTDKATQDSVLAHNADRDKTRQTLRDLGRALVEAVSTKGTSDEKIAEALKKFQDAVTVERARRTAADKALDAKIGYSKNARVLAVLTNLGMIGEDTLQVGPGNIGRGGFGGFGGGQPGGGAPGGGAGVPAGPAPGFGGPPPAAAPVAIPRAAV